MALKCMILENNESREERHAAIEKAVSEYLKQDVQIEYSSKGKPSLVGMESQKHISVARAGDKLLVAVNDTPIGIDIEYLPAYDEDKLDFGAMAEKYLSGEEAEYVHGSGAEGEKERFLKIWVRKEAYVKCAEKTVADFPSFSVVDGEKLLNKVSGISIRKFGFKFDGCEDYLMAIAGV